MSPPVRVTAPLLDVLDVLLGALADGDEMHGWAIARAAGRSGPTVYGVIDRLEDSGWVTGRWERENPQPGKPRRRLYMLTSPGASAARDLLTARCGERSPVRAQPHRALPGLGRLGGTVPEGAQ
jgi:PadR family transcriptional regulator, regulatory protein PadR